MAKHGGARANAGRKSIVEELGSRELSVSAIVDFYGGVKEGMVALLATGNPLLIKFVFEHAFGKPVDNVNLSGAVDVTVTGMKVI